MTKRMRSEDIDPLVERSLTEAVKAFKRAEPSLNYLKLASSSFQSTLLQMSQIREDFVLQQKAMTSFLDSIRFSLLDVQKFALRAQRFLENLEIEERVMLEAGWWPTPSIMNMPANSIRAAVQKFKNGNKSSITDFYLSTYHKDKGEYLIDTVKTWEKNLYFKPWNPIIKDALEAHLQKKYSLSIPVLFIVIEAIIKEFCKKNKIEVPNSRSKPNDKIVSAIKNEAGNEGLKYLQVDAFFIAIQERIYSDTGLLKGKNFSHFLNRNAILHGLTSKYGSPKNSLQCFMVLDILNVLKGKVSKNP